MPAHRQFNDTGAMESRPARQGFSGSLIFALLFFAGAALLLSQIGSQAKFSSSGKLVAQQVARGAVDTDVSAFAADRFA